MNPLKQMASRVKGTFNFNTVKPAAAPPAIADMGLSVEETNSMLQTQHGVFYTLRDNPATNQVMVNRSGEPTTLGKMAIVLQHLGFDTTTYSLSEATGQKVTTVEVTVRRLAHVLRDALGLKLVRTDTRVSLASDAHVIANQTRCQNKIDACLKPAMALASDIESMSRTGKAVVLPAGVQMFLDAAKNYQALPEANQKSLAA